MALKDELGYFLEEKHKIYLNEFCTAFEKNLSDFYRKFSEVLKKLAFPLKDSTVVNLRQYVEDSIKYSDMDFSNKNVRNISNTILREFDKSLSQLAFDIVSVTRQQRWETKHGVFSVINKYFDWDGDKKYDSVTEFLESCYGDVYENIRMLFGGMVYGKKF